MGQYLYRHSLLECLSAKFHNYDYQDGVPMGGFVEGSATITPDGTIYLVRYMEFAISIRKQLKPTKPFLL